MPDVFAAYRSLDEVPTRFGPAALTVGNFDGVHQGHARILREVVSLAHERGWHAAALTFDPHPTKIVAPDRVPRLLTTLDRRLSLLAEAGLDAALVLPFTADVARLEPAEFVEGILVRKLSARAVAVGDNFRFGRRHAGDVKTLEALGRQHGFEVRVVEPVLCRGKVVSSSRIRGLIGEGAVSRVVRMLGRAFSLDGRVIPGHGIGARQTVPTLNLAPDTEMVPARGVYVTCTLDPDTGRRWPSVTNVGYRPTFGGHGLSVETFLLRPLDGPSPTRLSVAFWHRLRDEKKFPTPEDLRHQILRDVATAEKFLRRIQAGGQNEAAPPPGPAVPSAPAGRSEPTITI